MYVHIYENDELKRSFNLLKLKQATSINFARHKTVKIAQDLPRALKETYISKRFSSLRFISFMGRKENYKTNTVQFSCSVMSNSLEPHGLQHASLPCPSPTPGLIQTHVPRVSDAIQPSHPLSSLSPPVFNLSQHQCLFQ